MDHWKDFPKGAPYSVLFSSLPLRHNSYLLLHIRLIKKIVDIRNAKVFEKPFEDLSRHLHAN